MKLKKHKHVITPSKKVSLGRLKLGPDAQAEESTGLLMEFAEKGDFFQFLSKRTKPFTEQLSRTYFTQLLAGLSHIHHYGVAHCDLKLENLVLDSNYLLKIIDFDTARAKSDTHFKPKGTPCYRAPELISSEPVKDYKKCDIYSAGIILFIMVCKSLPWKENDPQGEQLKELFITNKQDFWDKHAQIQNRRGIDLWSTSFVDLFERMCAPNPEERITLEQVKYHKWTMGALYEEDEIEYAILSGNYYSRK